jgi:PadR family transcriptional regulator PadR
MPALKLTAAVVKVLMCFIEDVDADRYGMDLMRDSGLASGSLYPILARLEAADWVTARWEDIDPEVAGRPARRYYRLTPDGIVSARTELAAMHSRLSKALGPIGQPRTT